MKLSETGFRPVYHYVCAFEMNDKLRELAKNCPDVDKSSHVIFYGYIDPKQGLTLELLGTGKAAKKYFYFKDPYVGERINVMAFHVENVEFLYFPKLEPRFYKKFEPRIKMLDQFAASEDLEKTRTFEFLDPSRSLQFPDHVKVYLKQNDKVIDQVLVSITGTGDHLILGRLIERARKANIPPNNPISFYVEELDNKEVICCADIDQHSIKDSELDDGSALKAILQVFDQSSVQTESERQYQFLLSIFRSSLLVLPVKTSLSKESQKVLDDLKKQGKTPDDLTDKDREKFDDGVSAIPLILEKNNEDYLAVFTSKDEYKDKLPDADKEPLIVTADDLISYAKKTQIKYLVLNPYTDNVVITKNIFDAILRKKSLRKESPQKSVQPQSNTPHSDLEIGVGKMDIFNYALYLNNVSPIIDIRVLNHTDDTMENLVLKIHSTPALFAPFESVLPPIPSEKVIHLGDPDLVVDGQMLGNLNESLNVSITIEIDQDNHCLAQLKGEMNVLAYDQWMGSESYRDGLAAFVLPNHPIIACLLHDAADRLSKWKKSPALDGYQSEDPNRVRDLAAAAFAAIQKKNIVYAEPPASFTIAGQRIRTPEVIMDQHLGTCMDMTLLYAACLEAMGLHPLLVLLNGHIFAGVWLRKRSADELKSQDVVIENLNELTTRFHNGSDELTFVECTAMCAGKHQVSFEDAEHAAKGDLLNKPDDFRYAIDVCLARIYKIRPLPSRTSENGRYQVEIEERSEKDITKAPSALDIAPYQQPTASTLKVTNKKDLWESKLLDLTTRNMLLNLPHNASIEPIISSHVDELEDAIADGHEFHLLPVPEWLVSLSYAKVDENGKESEPMSWLAEALKKNGVYEMTDWPVGQDFDFNEKIRQEYHSHRLYTFHDDKSLDHDLTTIYRASRSAMQENGVSSLYLAIGLLKWIDEDKKNTHYAPLILEPIEIIRKSAHQGYALHARDEDPHFNTTLLELLKQQFNLTVNGLDPLPTDEHGINIRMVFTIMRNAIRALKDWEVVETCVIGNFSFAQFAMWNDIHTADNALENSNVVRSLMKGRIDWNINETAEASDAHMYLPITVDETQLKTIKMASSGRTFVLHGPPGTGKSQTITGMIANLMAQGKTVLFVAEKMAALSVVERRLTQLGLQDFCLELHSDKANKKHVLGQLEQVLSIRKESSSQDYQQLLAETTALRNKLDIYVKHLYQAYPGGYNLHDLIDLYETVRDVPDAIHFDEDEAGALTKDQIAQHLSLIGQLAASGSAVKGIVPSTFAGIHLTSYGSEIRADLPARIEAYKAALKQLHTNDNNVFSILRTSDLQQTAALISLYTTGRRFNSLIATLLQPLPEQISSYYDQKAAVEAERSRMEGLWKVDALSIDVNSLLQIYDDSHHKLFGRGKAMAAVTDEVQQISRKDIAYEEIPDLLSQTEKYQNDRHDLDSSFASLSVDDQNFIKQIDNRQYYDKAVATAREYQAKFESFPGGLQQILTLSHDKSTDGKLMALASQLENLKQSQKDLNDLLQRAPTALTNHFVTEELAFCDELLAQRGLLKDYSVYNRYRKACLDAGLKPVVDAYEHGMSGNKLVTAYQKGFSYALINHIINHDDALSSFSGPTFNEAVEQFKDLDDRLIQETRKEIYYLLASRLPSVLDSPETAKELNLVRKAIGSNGRGISIRSLFARIPHILRKLTPCMLMSPNSVAQYLEQKNDLFDVVIFDEASQLPTCKAIGALYRAKNAIIVGDPKQMPPTSFFAGNGPEVSDLALADLDSILDDSLALGIPSQYLQWHYRSRHESLIAFSNNEFYDNKMFTFPSADDRERYVTSRYVHGIYDKGVNEIEAKAVVEEIMRRYHDPEHKKESIGVVTFNIKQQTLIENLLAKEYQNHPDFDAWANNGDDPLFVKNLENVQGDERDVILFSIGFGPDERGRISMNFGPINREGGGKRLNVAFSRSRLAMIIFTSMHFTDITVTENSADGVIAFRDFLRYAEGNPLPNLSAEKHDNDLQKAGILNSICSEITKHGYVCDKMVGKSDFHVDIAVLNPVNPDEYLLGIMLDGETYHHTENTRDREVAQTGVLRNLGWNLLRVWTIDWWDNRQKVMHQILSALAQLKTEAVKAQPEKAAAAPEKPESESVDPVQQNTVETPLDNSNEPANTTDTAAASVERKEEPKSVKPNPEESPSSLSALLQTIHDKHIELIDKRNNGGALWMVGGQELRPIVDSFQKAGVHFTFKAGGDTATSKRDAWWAKTDISLSADKPVKLAEKPASQPIASHTTPSQHTLVIRAYQEASLTKTPVTQEEFADRSNRDEIGRRAIQILETEAPLLKDILLKKIFDSFGISKTDNALTTCEKALKQVKVKTTKQKGIPFCWLPEQDPKEYAGIRTAGSRTAVEIPQQEIKNAICYVLKQKGDLDKTVLIKETANLFGYKRVGKNVETAMLNGLQHARSCNAVETKPGGKIGLKKAD